MFCRLMNMADKTNDVFDKFLSRTVQSILGKTCFFQLIKSSFKVFVHVGGKWWRIIFFTFSSPIISYEDPKVTWVRTNTHSSKQCRMLLNNSFPYLRHKRLDFCFVCFSLSFGCRYFKQTDLVLRRRKITALTTTTHGPSSLINAWKFYWQIFWDKITVNVLVTACNFPIRVI